MKKTAQNEEILLDADTGEELALEDEEVTANKLASKMKEMRAALKVCQKERDDNLAGWQRAKADLVNFRRTVEEDRMRDTRRAQGNVVRAILPALDSFENAMADSGWNRVEKEWREGVERVASQLKGSLEKEGLVAFTEVKDQFDPTLHECMSVVAADDELSDHTVHQVLQKGYKLGDEVIRPAKVVVAQYTAP